MALKLNITEQVNAQGFTTLQDALTWAQKYVSQIAATGGVIQSLSISENYDFLPTVIDVPHLMVANEKTWNATLHLVIPVKSVETVE